MERALRLAYLGLGANLGRPGETVALALKALGEVEGIAQVRASHLWRTRPIGGAGPDYCNAVAEIRTTLEAPALMAELLAIEQRHGRTRSIRNAPRTLDLDIIAMDGERCESAGLTLPHPRAHERAFVLVPLCELNPDVLIGPANTTLERAVHWHGLLSAEQLGEVTPW